MGVYGFLLCVRGGVCCVCVGDRVRGVGLFGLFLWECVGELGYLGGVCVCGCVWCVCVCVCAF